MAAPQSDGAGGNKLPQLPNRDAEYFLGALEKGWAFQSREPDCGGVGGAGQASSFGGNGLLRPLVVALPRGCRCQGGRIRAIGRRDWVVRLRPVG